MDEETCLIAPVYYAYTPCASCLQVADAGKCKTCTLNLCSFCARVHDCSDRGGAFEDSRCPSPGALLDEEPPEDAFTQPPSNELYVRLNETWSHIWAPLVAVDHNIYLRVRHLQALSSALIYEPQEEPRQFGLQSDWKKLMFDMNWDATGFVVINLDRQRCALFIPGQPFPEFVGIKRGLELLIHQRKMIGFGERRVDSWREFAHIEVWFNPNEGSEKRKNIIHPLNIHKHIPSFAS